MMKVASFNVNSLRARLAIVIDWLEKARPDVLAVQETKVQDADFPGEAFDEIGYKYVFAGQKSYNGVALFSQVEMTDVRVGLDDEPRDESRLICARINGISIVNTYVPQGDSPVSPKYRYKLKWFERLGAYFANNFSADEPVLWVGDLNVAPEARDVHDPKRLLGHVCFNEQVGLALEKVKSWGFEDVFRRHCDEGGMYTFWDYRARNALQANRGWRIDHVMATRPLAEASTACYVDKEPRAAERPSDHTPLIAEFDW